VLIKMAALALFIAVALPVFDASHFQPFMPSASRAAARRAAKSG
jgi:APA family basic amino acid/polyamine antiporter